MSTDVLGNFTCLDELVQVIYQSVYRFVILSAVSDKWYIHLGLSGPEGRWWRGSWSKHDILQIAGAKSSDKLLEAFAEKLAETITQGDLQVGDWTPEKGAKINLTFGPTSKKPIHMPLEEMNSEDAASHATNIFLEARTLPLFTRDCTPLTRRKLKIALQAQSRKCRLHPDPYAASSFIPTFDVQATKPGAERTVASNPRRAPSPRVDEDKETSRDTPALATEHKRESVKTRPAQNVARTAEGSGVSKSIPPKSKSQTPAPAPKPVARVHLAKKARKYEAIEFESDED